MAQKTSKWVAAKTIQGTRYYDNGCRTADGTPYLTTSGRDAKSYAAPGTLGPQAPKGYRIVRITYTSPVCGGGWFTQAGPTGA